MVIKGDNILGIGPSSISGVDVLGNNPVESAPAGGGDNPPITTDLLVYYNPDVEVYSDAGSTLAVDGNNVRQFNDQSGNDNTLSQSTASLQPVYDTTTFSGSNASLNSLNDSLLLTSNLNFNTTTSFTFYMVYKKSSNTTIRNWFVNTTNYLRLDMRASLIGIRADAGEFRYVTYTDDANIKIMALTVDRSNGEFKLYINGSYIGEGASAGYYQTNPPSYTIQKLFSNGGATMNVGNVLFYTDSHDATQVGQISDWLNDKYSIY